MRYNIAIILGEPNSINLELLKKLLVTIPKKIRDKITIIGSRELINKQSKKLNLNFTMKGVKLLDVKLNFKEPFKINLKDNSKYVLKCLDVAHKMAMRKEIIGFINCPINKKIFEKKIGVTEYLSKKNALKNNVMLIHNKSLSVTPLTHHINIKDVSKKITKKLIIDKVLLLNDCYKKLFYKKPKIAILGINPHNGELRKNSEEEKIIKPSINGLIKKRINIQGPFSTDSIFLGKKYEQFDVIVGMYHDQILGPYKALFGYDAINITLGLKYIRVSPDHGVANDIIGKNKANVESLLKAMNFFRDLK